MGTFARVVGALEGFDRADAGGGIFVRPFYA
jgi:hypothetical protein